MPYEKGCSYWEAMQSSEKLTAEEIGRGIISKPSTRIVPRDRRITQITGNSDGLWALCDDGSLWLLRIDCWTEMPPIPLACDEQEVPQKAPERRVLIITRKKNDERARMPGDKVTIIKPSDLDRLTRGCEFDHVIFDEGIRYHDVAEHLYMILLRMRNGTLESSKDFFVKSGFLSFSDVIKRSGEIS
jgi:hypothetical protein